MLSSSASATSAKESVFRIQSPNSSPRRIGIVFMGSEPTSGFEDLLGAVTTKGLPKYRLVVLTPSTAGEQEMGFALQSLSGDPLEAGAWFARVDELLLILTAGSHAEQAHAFARYCNDNKRLFTVFVHHDEGDAPALKQAEYITSQVRPYAGMLILSEDKDYARAMLDALQPERQRS